MKRITPLKTLPDQSSMEKHILEFFKMQGLIRPENTHLYVMFIKDMCSHLTKRMFEDMEQILSRLMPPENNQEGFDIDKFLNEDD